MLGTGSAGAAALSIGGRKKQIDDELKRQLGD
jgi:hypothetical protein